MSYYPGNEVSLGTILGEDRTLTLFPQDRARHTYIVGSTRTGKTKLMEDMARQDLISWPDHQCPMVVIDPHGTLFDGLMGYAAAEGLNEWPIIPFDLRRNDLVVSYNLLHRRNAADDPSVICRSFVEAILHAWGQSNSQETPRLASTLASILMLAYEKEITLIEALDVITHPKLRKLLTAEVQHLVARAVLRSAQALGEKGFQERVESTMNRITGFLTTQLVQVTLCQTGDTLDMSEILEQGKILLACLSTEKGRINTEDTWALGSVLLADLWNAAKRRGKAEEGERAPCYVHIDEFQNFLTPDIALGLSEASGFGLHLTVAHQYPSQLPDRGGELGKMILNAVLATAKNKFAFQLEHPDDLDLLARVIGRQAIDLDKVKHEIWSTKVVAYKLAWLPAFSHSTSQSVAHSQQWGEHHSTGHVVARNWNDSTGVTGSIAFDQVETESDGDGEASSTGITASQGDSTARNRQRTRSSSDTDSLTEANQWTKGTTSNKGGSNGTGTSLSEEYNFGPLHEVLQEEIRRYEEGEMDEEEVQEFKRQWPQGYSRNEGKSSNQSENWNEGENASEGGSLARGRAHTEGATEAEGESEAHSNSLALSQNATRSSQRLRSRNHGTTTGISTTASHTEGASEAESEQSGESYKEGVTNTNGDTEGVTLSPMLIPVMGKELSSRQFESKDDQLFRITQFLDAQKDRHCLVRLASDRRPMSLYTRTVEPPMTTKEFREEWTIELLRQLPFVALMEDAQRRIDNRRDSLHDRLLSPTQVDEPITNRRKVASRPAEPGPSAAGESQGSAS